MANDDGTVCSAAGPGDCGAGHPQSRDSGPVDQAIMTTCVDRADHQSVATATQIAADETRWREGMTMGRDPETPAEALEQLAEGCVWVRFAVASNPSSPGLLLARLAKDEAPLVRRRVALHPNTDPRVRRRLVADANDLVRQAAVG